MLCCTPETPRTIDRIGRSPIEAASADTGSLYRSASSARRDGPVGSV